MYSYCSYYDYYDYSDYDVISILTGLMSLAVIWVIALLLMALMIVAMWILFKKAGLPLLQLLFGDVVLGQRGDLRVLGGAADRAGLALLQVLGQQTRSVGV